MKVFFFTSLLITFFAVCLSHFIFGASPKRECERYMPGPSSVYNNGRAEPECVKYR